MKQETLSIAFFIRKTNLLKNGEAPITIRVTFKGVSEEARIHRTIDPRLWNQAKSCSKGKDKSSLEINDYIESLRVKVRSLYKELLLAEEHITPKYLLAGLFNQKNKQTVLKTMKTEIERMEELIGIDYEKVTINRYWNCYKSVATCISQFYKKEDKGMRIADISIAAEHELLLYKVQRGEMSAKDFMMVIEQHTEQCVNEIVRRKMTT